MAKAGEQVKSPTDLLGEVQQAWGEQRAREFQAANEVAAAVVAAGGTTERDVFVFAMYGIMADRPIDQREIDKMKYFYQLENRFANGPVARKSTVTNYLPFLSAMALPKRGEEDPIQYKIEKEFPGYVGTVELAVTDVHTWHSFRGVENPEITPEDAFRLAYVTADVRGGRSFASDHDFTKDFAVGLDEIYGLRELGAGGHANDDLAFLGRIATFLQDIDGKTYL